MRTVLVLLSVWIKGQLRLAFDRVSWRWMIGDAWLPVASLAIGVGASTYFAIRFLGEWQESPELINYLDWYLFIAVSFLSVVSLLHFVVFLSSQPDSLFLHLSPTPRWKLYIARLVFVLLSNLIFFLVISFPPLIIIGLWAEEGRWGYFALLPVVGVFISLTAALTGAIFAAPTSFLLRFLPQRLRERAIYSKATAMVSVAYLSVTCFLPALLPPIPFSGWWSVARPFVTGVIHWTHPTLTVVYVFCLLGLFLWVYAAVSKVVPFEERAAVTKRTLVAVVRFRRFPLIQRELAAGWWWVVFLGVGSGIGFWLILRESVAVPVLERIVFPVGIIPVLLIDLLPGSGLTIEKTFFLVKSAPIALFSVVWRRFLVLYLQVSVVCIIAVSIYAFQLRQAGEAWEEAFLFLPVPLLYIVFPLTAALLTRRSFTFHPFKELSILKASSIVIIDFLLFSLVFFASGFLFPSPYLFSLAVLAWQTAVFFTVCLIGVYFLLRLVARRLARIEWL